MVRILVCITCLCVLCGCRRTIVRLPTPWGNAWLISNVTNEVKFEVTVNPR